MPIERKSPDWYVRECWPSQVPRFELAAPSPSDAPAVAVVNWGRWIVHCPSCRSAQIGDPTRALFFCVDCLNAAIENRLRRVAYPTVDDVVVIERLLLPRGEENRNWEGESLVELEAENVMHGVPVLEA